MNDDRTDGHKIKKASKFDTFDFLELPIWRNIQIGRR